MIRGRIVAYLKRLRHRAAMKEIRSGFLFFGCNLSDMTDEEIAEKVTEVGVLLSDFGISADEAADAFREFALYLSAAN